MTNIETASADEQMGLLGAVVHAYREEGYQRGYRQALDDLLASLVPVTEEYLRRRRSAGPAERQLLYGYVELLERRINAAASDGGYVTEGLGI